jgi:mono/diheme cytochrome c family protein
VSFRIGSAAAAMWMVLCLSAIDTSRGEEPTKAPNPSPPGASYHGGDRVAEGRSLFNQYCSHCHGPNAIQGERPRDLRRLTLRYGQRAPEVFWQTVTNGRPDKGMPVWKGTLSDEVLARILGYLETVQTTP